MAKFQKVMTIFVPDVGEVEAHVLEIQHGAFSRHTLLYAFLPGGEELEGDAKDAVRAELIERGIIP